MPVCIECDALLSAYTGATERYAGLVATLVSAVAHEAFQYPELQKVKDEIAEARLSCNRARKILSTHRESQVCRRFGMFASINATPLVARQSVPALGSKRLQDLAPSSIPPDF